jgi:GT2 family glycosyltransferase
MAKSTPNVSVVIPSWNAKDELKSCLDSLLAQTLEHRIIVVENGSVDGSVEFIQEAYPQIELIVHEVNKGFAGGVNAGIRRSIEQSDDYVALFNNDAIADKNWLKHLVEAAETSGTIGIVTCKFMDIEGKHLDSTGDIFTSWGLPYPRGRGEPVSDKYDTETEIFGASGGASLYRIAMLQEIGLFDEDFFAYYEDVDISFRAQLMGWKVRYAPEAIAYHQIGATSGKIRGFTTYQTMKNLPLVVYKNVPRKYLWHITWRSLVARTLFFGRAILRGQGWYALKGDMKATYLTFKKRGERKRIQKLRKVSEEYVWSIIEHNLPPNAYKLRKLRSLYNSLSPLRRD